MHVAGASRLTGRFRRVGAIVAWREEGPRRILGCTYRSPLVRPTSASHWAGI